MKKILVTGATGFIGNYVVNELLNNNFKVIATSTDSQKAEKYSWFSSIKYIPFSLDHYNEKENYFSYFDSPDLLIHLAWEGLPNYKSSFHFEKNLYNHYFLLKNLIANGLSDITVTGTCFEYGMKMGKLDEEMIPDPANAYALAKDCLRKFLNELGKSYSFSLKWVRLFYMYGKGQNPNSLFSQLDKAIENGDSSFNMSGGEQVRDFLPVRIVAEYIAKIANQNKVTGIINCCSGVPIKIKDLVEQYLRKKNKSISLNLGFYPYSDYEPMEFWGDTKKLKTIIENE